MIVSGFFCKGWSNLSKDVLVLVVCWPAGLNRSFIYKELKLLKYSKVIELINCSNWSSSVTNWFYQIQIRLYVLYYSDSDKRICISFDVFVILTFICCLCLDTKGNTHNQNEVATQHYIVVWKSIFSIKTHESFINFIDNFQNHRFSRNVFI